MTKYATYKAACNGTSIYIAFLSIYIPQECKIFPLVF